MKKQFLLAISLLMLSALLAGCAGSAIGTPAPTAVSYLSATTPSGLFKLAAIFPGVVTDADYNTLAYIGINEVQRELDIDTAYEEKVDVSKADAVIREFIADGYNIIWTHGGQFVSDTVDLARHFPEVYFIAEGDEPVVDRPANLWFIDRNFQTGFYVIGATAALSTRTGKIGYLGGERLPFTYAEVHAVQQAISDLGLKDQVELKAVWVEDFNDPVKARELADGLIAQDVDFILGSLNLGMYGAFEAVKNADHKGVLITAKYIDKSDFAPEHYVTSLLFDFSLPLQVIVQKIMSGESGGYYPLNFNAGKSMQLPFTNVDPSIEKQAMMLLDNIINGDILVRMDTSPIP
jgi:basic membrane protein A